MPETEVEIVGVVADAKYSSLTEDPPPTFYVSYLQTSPRPMTVEVRADVGDAASLAPSIREALRRISPGLPLANVTTQQQQMDDTTSAPRTLAAAAGAFAVLGILLACVGVYGIVSHDVVRRTRELGVRMALGAGQGHVVWRVVRDVLVVTAIGSALGAVAAVGAGTLIERLLFGVTPADPITTAGAVLVLALAAMAAACGPERRAARLGPTEAMKVE